MGIGISLFLIAVGAVLTWAVVDTSEGIDLAAVGVILMVVGFIGLGLMLAFWSSFSPFADSAPFRRTAAAGPRYDNTVVEVHEPRRTRETVVVREAPRTVVTHEEPPTERVVIREEDPSDRV